MLTIGIDDAGRGPLIGPMILAGVLADENSETTFKKIGVKDSKMLLHEKRIKLSKLIEQASLAFHVVKTYPEQIDSALQDKINLNTLEAMKTAEIINALNSEDKKIKVIVDCPSTNTFAWRKTLFGFIKHPDNLEVHCEHKADANHASVSAASILAKVAREEEVSKLKKQYGKIGSGYPSDPDTKMFLQKQGKQLANSGIFRKSWATWKSMFPEYSKEKKQTSLGDY